MKEFVLIGKFAVCVIEPQERKKKIELQGAGLLLPSATHVQTRTMVCGKPCINNKYPG